MQMKKIIMGAMLFVIPFTIISCSSKTDEVSRLNKNEIVDTKLIKNGGFTYEIPNDWMAVEKASTKTVSNYTPKKEIDNAYSSNIGFLFREGKARPLKEMNEFVSDEFKATMQTQVEGLSDYKTRNAQIGKYTVFIVEYTFIVEGKKYKETIYSPILDDGYIGIAATNAYDGYDSEKVAEQMVFTLKKTELE